ncbi:hypothetical protein BCT61_07620 [Vibrio breoganii]|uniref:amylo-alpha-1,6-glucosidase n=1 Tax=Vibrio breoganii TaxID=553239 RepID=UPI000C851849|nr:amylo-alpha-1,6-glucosidase [Vibrio breoganii]PMM11060.1 hypothetical protein BCT61_07620 [Vibrio breoganii]
MNTPKLYVKGSFNGWGLDTPLCRLTNTHWQVTLPLAADSHSFKISDQDGSVDWTLSGNTNKATKINLNETLTLVATTGIGNDLHFESRTAQRYTLDLFFEAEQFRVTIEQGGINNEQVRARPLFKDSVDIVDSPSTALNEHKNNCLEINELFNELTISKDNSFSYVFGDNLDGYYEGSSHQYVNAGKYRNHRGWLLGSIASFRDNVLLDKTQALSASLKPFGIEHLFDSASETCSLLSGYRSMVVHLESDSLAELSIVPELNIPLDHCSIEKFDAGVLISLDSEIYQGDSPTYISICCDTAFKAEEVTFEQFPELDSIVNLDGNNLKIKFTTSSPKQNCTFYVSLANSPQQAKEYAKQFSTENAYICHKKSIYNFLCTNYLWTNDTHYNKALMWARLASRAFVNDEFGKGIWAGLPWFKDCWGRDTFIALSGTSLINAKFQEAKEIILNFADMQLTDFQSVNFGRIPNRVTSKTNIIYNTTDGTPWMLREIWQYINYSGDLSFANDIYPTVKRFIEGVESNYLDSDGLMKHRDPDTWMDAKINGQIPWSPRGNKANDIQALWFESLNCAMGLAELTQDTESGRRWQLLSTKIKQSFKQQFWHADKKILADRIQTDGTPDYSVRPNQLMTISIPQNKKLVSDEIAEHIINNAVSRLLFPWGICSLEQTHENFHPYHIDQPAYHKDAAYHNGTIWGWNAGFTVSALTRYQKQDLAFELSSNLAQQILNLGHLGTMSENLNAFQNDISHLTESGTFSQAWSVSEYARNAQQDYLGYKPLFTKHRLELTPMIPSKWSRFVTKLPIGQEKELELTMRKSNETQCFEITIEPVKGIELLRFNLVAPNGVRTVCEFDVSQGLKTAINWDGNSAELITGEEQLVRHTKMSGPETSALLDLKFAEPNWELKHQSLIEQDYLLNKIQKSSVTIAKD